MNTITTITAAEFVEQGYAAKIKKGECVVICHSTNEVTDIQLSGESGTLYYKWFGQFSTGHEFESVRPTDTFDVEWVKDLMTAETPQRAPDAGEATGEVSDGVALARAQIARLQSALETIRDYPTVEADMDLGHQVAGMAMQAEVALEEVPSNSGLLTILADKLATLQAALAASRKREAALREALEQAFWHVENIPSEALNHNRVAQGEVDAAYEVLEAAIKQAAGALQAAALQAADEGVK